MVVMILIFRERPNQNYTNVFSRLPIESSQQRSVYFKFIVYSRIRSSMTDLLYQIQGSQLCVLKF